MALGKNGNTATAFFGWHVVGAAFTVAVFAWGVGFYGPPIFLQTLHVSRGWSVAVLSAAITVHFLVGAACVANLATLHRRFGVSAITRTSGILTAIGLLGWAFVQQPWELFVATIVSGLGWATSSGAALNAMVSPWFLRRRPAALSVAFNGASLGGVIFSPLWAALIAALGFSAAAGIVGSVVVLVFFLIARVYLARTPEQMAQQPDGGTRDNVSFPGMPANAAPLQAAWRERRFISLALAASLGLFAQIGLVAQLFSILVPALGGTGAGIAMGTATTCAIGGRTAMGLVMGGRSERRVVAAANAGLQACGSLFFILSGGDDGVLLLTGCIVFGLGLGNVTSLPPLIVQSEFAAHDVQRAVSLVTACSQASYAFAPLAFGVLRDLGPMPNFGLPDTGAPLLFAAALVLQAMSAAAFLLGRSVAKGSRRSQCALRT